MSDSRDFNDYTCTVCGQVITQMGHEPGKPCPGPGKLGRFDHHPDPATDFCIEVDAIEGLEADVKAGLSKPEELFRRLERAMDFTVGGDAQAVAAKNLLRSIEARKGTWS